MLTLYLICSNSRITPRSMRLFYWLNKTAMAFNLITPELRNWQNRKEWFFNRDHTDTYELWYEGRYKRAELWQKKIMGDLIQRDRRVKTLLEFGCGTTRFTRWWHEINIEASDGD